MSELDALCDSFENVELFPLTAYGVEKKRDTPSNLLVHPPIIENAKFPWRLKPSRIFKKEYLKRFSKAISFYNPKLIPSRWITFLSALNIVNEVLSNKHIKQCFESITNVDLLYFFWGNGSSFIVPFLENICANKYIRMHGTDLYEHLHQSGIPFRRQQIIYANKILSISTLGQKYLAERYPDQSNKIYVARLGTKKPLLQKDLELKSNILNIVSCSSITTVKRVHKIAEILSYCTAKIKWVHFGAGYLKEDLEEKIKILPNNIEVYLKGFTPNETIYKYYQENKIDLFINVSSSEGVPVTIMEAISFGIPILATNVGATSEIVNSETGILIPKDFKSKKVALILSKILEGDIDFNSESIRNFWEENYSARKNYAKLIQLFKDGITQKTKEINI